MKNILARGGIEFIAVILGLSGSLWIDNANEISNHKDQNRKILTRLYHNLEADSLDGVWNRDAYIRAVEGAENVMKWCDSNPTMATLTNEVEKDISAMTIATYFVNNEEEYNALKNSGRMDLINNEALIIKLHKYYTQLRFIKVIETSLQKNVGDDIMPFLSDCINENLYVPGDKESEVYSNYPKLNFIKLPNIHKLRYFATEALTWRGYALYQYEKEVKQVTELRQILREELNL
jgi:hypothetical protein